MLFARFFNVLKEDLQSFTVFCKDKICETHLNVNNHIFKLNNLQLNIFNRNPSVF